MRRENISSGAEWEEIVGYSRAVIVGQTIHISGTTATNEDGEIIGLNDAYEQTRFILDKISALLEAHNSSMENVFRTRMYVTDIEQWQEYGRAHSEYFREVKPATAMVEVSKLIHQDMLIEIEIEAYTA